MARGMVPEIHTHAQQLPGRTPAGCGRCEFPGPSASPRLHSAVSIGGIGGHFKRHARRCRRWIHLKAPKYTKTTYRINFVRSDLHLSPYQCVLDLQDGEPGAAGVPGWFDLGLHRRGGWRWSSRRLAVFRAGPMARNSVVACAGPCFRVEKLRQT